MIYWTPIGPSQLLRDVLTIAEKARDKFEGMPGVKPSGMPGVKPSDSTLSSVSRSIESVAQQIAQPRNFGVDRRMQRRIDIRSE